MPIHQLRGTAEKWYRQHLQGKSFYNPALKSDIRLSREGRKKTISSGKSEPHFAAIRQLPEILQKAILLHSHPDREGNPHIRAIHRLGVSLVRGKSIFELKITVKETTSGNHYYTHQIASENAKG